MTSVLIPAQPVPPTYPTRRTLLIGSAFATTGAAMFVLSLVGLYLSARHASNGAWFKTPDTINIPLTQPNMQFFTLLVSSVMMQWAVYAIARNYRSHAYLALGVTVLTGLAFVNQSLFLFKQMGLKMSAQEGPYFYALAGGHVALVCIGIVFIFLMTFRALGGQFSSRYPDGLSAAAIYWHTMVGLYGVIWLAVYIAK